MGKMRDFTLQTVLAAFGASVLAAGIPAGSWADIYRWEDDSGGIHFTDSPSNIPEKYRERKKMILKGPADPGRPTLSTVGSPAASPSAVSSEPVTEVVLPAEEDTAALAERLRAKIAAKERFIETIDRKRSQILNPLGNRFVSQEDLELYRKYTNELPQDRRQLRDLSPSSP